jgi:multiple sugar transport system permease protein
MKIVRYICLSAASLLFVFPLYWMITGSLKNQTSIWSSPPDWLPKQFIWDNYIHLFTTKPALNWIFNSVFTSLVTVVFVLFFSAMAGYAFAKRKFPGKNIIFALVLGTMMMPHQVTLVPLYMLIRNLNLLDSQMGLILPAIAFPLGVFLIRQFASTLPDEVIEAARIDGAGEMRLFTNIILPLIKPVLGALAIFAFMHTWNDYLWQLIVLQSSDKLTLPLGVSTMAYDELTINYGYAMAGASIAAIPMITFFLSLQKSFVKGITMGSVKG